MPFLVIGMSLFLIRLSHVSAQSNISQNEIVGKWMMCWSASPELEMQCNEAVTFDIFEDGTYRRNVPAIINSKPYEYTLGKWTLTGNHFVMDEDDKEGYIADPNAFDLKKMDGGLFVSEGYEGNKKKKKYLVYTYFKRITEE